MAGRGKGGKAQSKSSRTRSSRQKRRRNRSPAIPLPGLQFTRDRLLWHVRKGCFAAVYLAAQMELLAAEMMEFVEKSASEEKKHPDIKAKGQKEVAGSHKELCALLFRTLPNMNRVLHAK